MSCPWTFLKKDDPQRNGHTGLLYRYLTVDIWKGKCLKNGHEKSRRVCKNPLATFDFHCIIISKRECFPQEG